MRLRIGVVLCLFAVILGAGCRKPLTPIVDTDQAPETWITAAPMDSITIRDGSGRPVDPLPGDKSNRRIPVRFHLYWAGSDQDGTVVGYYWAVTETTATPEPGSTLPPPVPGPKPQDYHFTTRTDTTFIFNVSENAPDREHAFFIYAVDNNGKADPTPARFLFTAIDHFPPIPIFLTARGVGHTIPFSPNQPRTTVIDSVYFNDISDPQTPPRDTVAANARLDFAWSARLGIVGNDVKKFCYKLDEPDFVCGDSSTRSVSYNTGLPGTPRVAVGTKVFRLRAVDVAGGAADSSRRCYMNYAPDSWFWGPDPNSAPFAQTRDGLNGDLHYVDLAGVSIPGSPMSSDTLTVMPVDRPERPTFYEIYGNRLYAHVEGDTVHLNSWTIFYSGGYDKDSDYRVKVDPLDPALPSDTSQTPVLNPRPANGSPIGFRSQLTIEENPYGTRVPFVASGLAPVFLPTSVSRVTTIGVYWPMIIAGRAFIVTRAQDGDDLVDPTVSGDPATLVNDVENTGGTPEEQLYRHKIISFYVNKAPYLLTCDPSFKPVDPTCNPQNPPPTTTFTGTLWTGINLPGNDVDPYDPQQRSGYPYGGPTSGKPLRYRVTILAPDKLGNQREWDYHLIPTATSSPYFFNTPNFNMDLSTQVYAKNGSPDGGCSAADSMAAGNLTLRVQLCDCRDCEVKEGEGTCIVRTFPVIYTPPPMPIEAASSEHRGLSR